MTLKHSYCSLILICKFLKGFMIIAIASLEYFCSREYVQTLKKMLILAKIDIFVHFISLKPSTTITASCTGLLYNAFATKT